ncbi:MAG: hypothetical protein K2X82_06465 [Gemmataceae bacterium]|nr:hypothetical protein [Gemmataceae bacterium]
MPAPEPPSGQPGRVPLEWMRPVAEGMTADQVLGLVGPPAARLTRKGVTTPSEVFAALGSTLRFPGDRGLKEVWVYAHDRRGKFPLVGHRIETYVGFRGGVVAAVWREETKLAEPPGGAADGTPA